MFYRRKIILALMQLFNGELDKIRLQKLLFLISEKQQTKVYDFIPYKFGCFSYSANADLTTMVQKGLLRETNSHFIRADNADFFSTLNEADKRIVKSVSGHYGEMSANALMKYTYVNYPYFAINSVKAPEILSKTEYSVVNAMRNEDESTVLFTIGYEGISPEAYLNKLIRHNIHTLIDVRRNALSMKYGFSKSQLKRFCESVGIHYLHLPEVGISPDKRQTLNTQKDYNRLFDYYIHTCLVNTRTTQEHILGLLKVNKRVALTCFEADICQCHRKPLAESIAALPGFNYELKHI